MDGFLGMLEDLLLERVEVLFVVVFPVLLAACCRILSLQRSPANRLFWGFRSHVNNPALSSGDADNRKPNDSCDDHNEQGDFEHMTIREVRHITPSMAELLVSWKRGHSRRNNKEYRKSQELEYE